MYSMRTVVKNIASLEAAKTADHKSSHHENKESM